MSPLNESSDLELIALLKRGDPDAFTTIYRRYWKQIYIIAYNRLRSDADAEEIVQDIFLNFWKRRAEFDLKTDLRRYFAVAVKFEIIDLLRNRRHAARYDQDVLSQLSDADYSTLRSLDMLDLQEQLQVAIEALPEKCKLVFKMKYEQGLSQKQIGEELGISEKTTEGHLANARKKLRSSLGSSLPAVLFFYFF